MTKVGIWEKFAAERPARKPAPRKAAAKAS
jgi:hypothetical protein